MIGTLSNVLILLFSRFTICPSRLNLEVLHLKTQGADNLKTVKDVSCESQLCRRLHTSREGRETSVAMGEGSIEGKVFPEGGSRSVIKAEGDTEEGGPAAGGSGRDPRAIWGPGPEGPGSYAGDLSFPCGLAQGFLFPVWEGCWGQWGSHCGLTRAARGPGSAIPSASASSLGQRHLPPSSTPVTSAVSPCF